MINPIARSPIRNESAAAAPSTSDDAASMPQPNASAIEFDPRASPGRSGPPGFEPGTANLSRLALLAQLVEHLHGKEGADGSSPSEGSARAPQIAASRVQRACRISSMR